MSLGFKRNCKCGSNIPTYPFLKLIQPAPPPYNWVHQASNENITYKRSDGRFDEIKPILRGKKCSKFYRGGLVMETL